MSSLAETSTRVAAVMSALDLGTLTGAPVTVKAGSVPVYRVTATSGEYHMKFWADPRWEWRRSLLDGAATVERAAMAAGIPMPEPIALAHELQGHLVTVHRWVDGRQVEPSDNISGWLGAALARLHTIPAPETGPADSLSGFYGVHPEEEWASWLAEGQEHSLSWAKDEARFRRLIGAASRLVGEGLAASSRLAGSHRDVMGINILKNAAGGYVLVDWDGAGPEVPWFETVRAAVEFGRLAASSAGARALDPDPGVVRALVGSYLRHGGDQGPAGQLALAGILGLALNRIAFAIAQSLGHRQATDVERERQPAYIQQALEKLEHRLGSLDSLARLVAP